MKNLSLAFVLLLLSKFVSAQSPQGINYQTVVRNNSGTTISNHAIGIKFALHQGGPTGTITYAETQSGTTNTFGLITLIIGQGMPATGTFNAINWATGNIYLETQIDPAGGTNYQAIGTPQQLMSVPYAFYADTCNEHQQLSINGNQLSISSGNTVTLPNNSPTTTSSYFQQTITEGTGYSFVSATSEPNVDTFLPVFGYAPGNNNNSANAAIAQKDARTGSYQIIGDGGYAGQCGGGNGVFMTSATTHRGGIYFSYTNGCLNHAVATPSGPVTYDISPSNSNGIIFSDGTYLYVNNNSNWLSYTTSGSQLTLHSTFTFANVPSNIKAIMCSGTDIFVLTPSTLYKYDFNGVQAGSLPVYGSPTGLVNIDATKLYLVQATNTPASTTTYTGGFMMIPVGKP